MSSRQDTQKTENMICPEIHYLETPRGIMITGCYGHDGMIVLPDEMEGKAVTGLAPYTFASNREDEGEKIWRNPEVKVEWEKNLPRIAGVSLEEVWLPKYLTEVGRYAFYRCRNLKKLRLSNYLLDMGGGALTGCHLEEIEIDFEEGKKSCLKSIVEEMRYQLRIKLNYYKAEGAEVAKLLFPEHYEEAVENTPARILETHHHGAGGYYRQCFYNRELDYKKYDEMFYHTVAEDEAETAVELALCRLRYPVELTEKERESYSEYIKGHMDETAKLLVQREDIEGICFLKEQNLWTEEGIQKGMDLAAADKKTEILGILMDIRKEQFPKKKKSFEL